MFDSQSIIPVGKAGFIWCHGTVLSFWFCPFALEKPVLFDVTEPILINWMRGSLPRWKSRFYLMSRNFNILNHKAISVGKAGFIWCHGTYTFCNSCTSTRWKSRFYLMSRNPMLIHCCLALVKLEKPVLFDVTEPIYDWCWTATQLEKPVLFDVTEQFPTYLTSLCYSLSWKSRFYLMSRNNS